jgi:putative flippase GtrA
MGVSFREIAVYGAGAAGAFLVDAGLLTFQVEVLGIHYLVAGVISFLAGTAVVYWASIRHAFSFRRVRDGSSEFGIFAAIGAFGVLVNLGAMFASVEGFHLHYLVGKVLSGGLTFVLNFALRRILLFTPLGRGSLGSPTGSNR